MPTAALRWSKHQPPRRASKLDGAAYLGPAGLTAPTVSKPARAQLTEAGPRHGRNETKA